MRRGIIACEPTPDRRHWLNAGQPLPSTHLMEKVRRRVRMGGDYRLTPRPLKVSFIAQIRNETFACFLSMRANRNAWDFLSHAFLLSEVSSLHCSFTSSTSHPKIQKPNLSDKASAASSVKSPGSSSISTTASFGNLANALLSPSVSHRMFVHLTCIVISSKRRKRGRERPVSTSLQELIWLT